jgi:hypothetical protein
MLTVRLYGDGRDPQSFDVRLTLSAPGAQTPWGAFHRGHLDVRLFPATSNEFARAELSLEAAEATWTNAQPARWATTTNVQVVATFASAQGETNWANAGLVIRAGQAATRWGNAANLQLTLDAAPVPDRTNLVEASANLSASQIQTPWASATNARFTGQWRHSLTNPIPLSGQGRVDCEQVQTEWGAAGQLQFTANLADPATNPPAPADPSWGWWTNLQPYVLAWEAGLTDVKSHRLAADRIVSRGQWRAPDLVLTNLHADLYQGRFDAQASLNVATRALRASLESAVDPHRLSPLLFTEEPPWLAACSWVQPPEARAEASLVLPAWTNPAALKNWRAEAQPSLVLLGELTIARDAAYNGVAFSAAHSHLIYSNQVWRLPDPVVTRPEGSLAATYEASDVTSNYYWHISSTINPAALRPLFGTNQQPAFDFCTFTQPPILDAEVWGHGQDPAQLGVRGRVALTNFTFRGETVSALQTAFQFTNRVLQFTEPRLQRGTQQLNAASVAVDFNAEKIFLTNGSSTAEPLFVARAIGPHIVRIIEPYRFTRPPVVRGQGVLPIHGEEVADFHFDILDGGEFRWWKFTLQQVTARVHWQDHQVRLSDVRTELYHGQAAGSASFDFAPVGRSGTDYRFTLTTTNTSLQPLVADVFPGTNHLDGLLSGTLRVTNANTADDHSVQGSGNVNLRDGLIWNFPVFGVFSPVLNAIHPGMGNNRASAAAGNFTISNSVIYSDDLDIRTTGMRLQYRGTVDLEGHVNARAEASLLRDAWLIGPAISMMLSPVTKLFENQVTGTLSDPKTGPVFIPKAVLLPFQLSLHPFRTLKELMTEDNAAYPTNWPAIKGETTNSFGIYLTAQPVDRRITARGEGDWSAIPLAESPLISAADLITYNFATHSMKLRPEAVARIPRPPVEGTPFVVVANAERIYLGAFVTGQSSMSFAVPTIEVPPRASVTNQPSDTLVIDRAYPQPSFGVGPDPRGDPRIKQALAALRKLELAPPAP